MVANKHPVVTVAEKVIGKTKIQLDVRQAKKVLGTIEMKAFINRIRTFDGKEHSFSLVPERIRLSDDAQKLAVLALKAGKARLFGVKTGAEIWSSPQGAQMMDMSNDGRFISYSTKQSVVFYDLEKKRSSEIGISEAVRQLALTESGRNAACIYYGSSSVDVFDTTTASRITRLGTPSQDLFSVSITDGKDGLLVAVANTTGVVMLTSFAQFNVRLKRYGMSIP